jgi:hypothetical protein
MTALQILEKLGADASFGAHNLSKDENNAVKNIVESTAHFNAMLNITTPDSDEPQEDDREDDDKEEEKQG